MAIQIFSQALQIPENIDLPSVGTFLLDQVDERAGFVTQAPKPGNIRNIHFRTGTVTNETIVDARLEIVGTDGNPNESLIAAGANVSRTILTTEGSKWLRTANLTTPPTVTRGQMLGVVFVNPATGTPLWNLAYNTVTRAVVISGFPYGFSKLGSPPTYQPKTILHPSLALEYDDGTFAQIPGCYTSTTATASLAFDAGTTPDEIALRFKLPFPVRVVGCWSAMTTPPPAGEVKFILYDSNGTSELTSYTMDADHTTSSARRYREFLFPITVDLLKDTFYRLAAKPTAATDDCFMNYLEVDEAVNVALMDALTGGQNFHWSQQTNAGGWSETGFFDRRPMLGLLVSGFDDGAAAGGADRILMHPGMAGGMRG